MRRAAAAILMLALAACGGEEEDTPSPPLVFPEEPFRSTPPAPESPAPFALPMPEIFTLPAGIEVMLVERHGLPVVSWDISGPVGSSDDPVGKEGLASLCVNVMFQGSQRRDRASRELALADMAASIGAGAGTHDLGLSASCLRPDLDATLGLWAELVVTPGLLQTSFDGTVRARTQLPAPSLAPAAIAARVSQRVRFGPLHPDLRQPTAASFAAARLLDCQQLLKVAFAPKGARLEIAGDITRAEVEEKFGARLAALQGEPAMPVPPQPMMPMPGRLFFVEAPDAAQTIISVTSTGPARDAPDYYPATVMASVLAGGSITSRVGMNLRELRGYAYSVGGGFFYGAAGGYFDLVAPVRADASVESVREILAELARMRDSEVSEDELVRERDGQIAGLPYLFETMSQTLGAYATLATFKLPATYYRDHPTNFGMVTAASVREAAVRYLAPADLRILVVGDDQLLPMLQELVATHPDLAGTTLTRLDAEGRPR
jgi:zinc protease